MAESLKMLDELADLDYVLIEDCWAAGRDCVSRFQRNLTKDWLFRAPAGL